MVKEAFRLFYGGFDEIGKCEAVEKCVDFALEPIDNGPDLAGGRFVRRAVGLCIRTIEYGRVFAFCRAGDLMDRDLSEITGEGEPAVGTLERVEDAVSCHRLQNLGQKAFGNVQFTRQGIGVERFFRFGEDDQ